MSWLLGPNDNNWRCYKVEQCQIQKLHKSAMAMPDDMHEPDGSWEHTMHGLGGGHSAIVALVAVVVPTVSFALQAPQSFETPRPPATAIDSAMHEVALPQLELADQVVVTPPPAERGCQPPPPV